MGENYKDYEDDEVAMVTIELDDGTEMECMVAGIFDAGEEGRQYIAVIPEESEDEDEETYYLYRYSEDENGEPSIDNIESDEEYEIAAEAFDELLDEQYYLEQIDGEEDGES